MSQHPTPGRNAVFLEEMGVGALWRLRNNASAAPDAPLIAAQEAPEAEAPPAPPQPLAAVAVAPAIVTVATLATVAPAAIAAAAVEPASNAWFDDAPLPPPAAPVSDEAIAALDWAGLQAAAAKCTRCDLQRGRKTSVFGRGDRDADWLVVGSAPSRADEKQAQAISGDAGKLLDNMLLAIGLAPAANVYVTNLVKCRASDGAGADRAPTPEESAACRPYLERELALTGARIVLSLGQAAAGGLIRTPAPARGSVRRLGAIPVVATYHPADLLRQGDNKAKAWADLCLAKRTHAAPD